MSNKQPKDAFNILPKTDAPFTINDIKAAIPKHCYERPLTKSFYYLFRDIALVFILFYVASKFSSLPLGWTLWPVYWWIQGLVFTGLWVIAHECGHGAFSDSKYVNDVVGFIFHSLLLVPYFSWKYSHASHHISTNDLSRDTVFVPEKRSDCSNESEQELSDVSPLLDILILMRFFLFGWFAYLIVNTTNQKSKVWQSHFKPSSPMFKDSQRNFIHLSNVGIILSFILFGIVINKFGFLNWLNFYFIPYLFTNCWLVGYTLLQHTDRKIPHYESDDWTYLRGALATIDRPYGIFDWFHHEIGSTHVCHHLISKIPHYHALEATQHIKKVIGKYYNSTDEHPFVSLWREFRYCKFVEDKGAIRWFANFTVSPKKIN